MARYINHTSKIASTRTQLVTYMHLLYSRYYPPGPFPLPIIGNLHLMVKDYHTKFYNLAKRYGDVFTFSMGMKRYVVVNRIEPAREALVTKGSAFAGRDSTNYIHEVLSSGYNDIAFTDYGQYWTYSRKLTHSALKIYGDGMGKLESKIVRQYEKLNARLIMKTNEPVDLPGELGRTIINVICSKVFNREYESNDPQLQQIIKWAELLAETFSSIDFWLLGYMPFLRIFPLNCIRNITKLKQIRDPILNNILLEHENSFDPHNIRDFTDSLINACMEENVNSNNRNKRLTRVQMTMIMFDVVVAGFDTTWKTIHWCVLFLLHWPNYQDLMFHEIIEVVGDKRYPSSKDRQSLHMVQAVIQETLRLSPVVSVGLIHKAIEDNSIDGRPVPKDTPVIFNLWAINHDEKEWDNPDEFNPYRWIDENGMYNPRMHKSFLTFSVGKRACLGESMARTELFLLLSCLVRDFKISPNLNKPFPSLNGQNKFLLIPDDFDAILNPRN